MKKHKSYAAVIFDLDGLILDTETVSHSAWKRAMADFGFVLTDDVYKKIIGLIVPDIEEIFRIAFGTDLPLSRISQHRLRYINEHIAEHGIKVKPGLAELLSFLDTAGFRKAVATSSSRDSAIRKLTTVGLLDRFDAVVCGDEVQNGKPAPDIFLTAAEQLHTPPEGCLVFEDSDNGVRAAHKAGMTTIMVPDLIKPADEVLPLADRVFPSLYEAIPFLQELLGIPQ